MARRALAKKAEKRRRQRHHEELSLVQLGEHTQQLRSENARLKRLLAEAELAKDILRERAAKHRT